nr:immunoglobulin light chain junction region [Macaca mulatta]MOW61796.1 immunoglobulin light chain junction region [Macaca mulatta]MOW61825.1 immunoglobulin light chain junction region [Macaca mulatta]MOW61857.1 immunoglobulin light chain junction region [Macaca mulatta]MOW61858.1 immunoglobulin light chain junction region [Macaca mulatta]
CQQESDWNLTF